MTSDDRVIYVGSGDLFTALDLRITLLATGAQSADDGHGLPAEDPQGTTWECGQ